MNAEATATPHITSPSNRLTTFVSSGYAQLTLDDAELIAVAAQWSRAIVAEWGSKSSSLQAIENRALAKYVTAAQRDIKAAFASYNRWLFSQRKRGNEVESRLAAQRRDQKLRAAIYGLITSLKFV